MIAILTVAILLQMIILRGQDEDINLVYPSGTVSHSLSYDPAARYLTTINNCTCRESPSKMVVCSGTTCHNFPSSLTVSIPLFKLKVTGIEVIKKRDLLGISTVEALEIEGNPKLVKIEAGSFIRMKNLENLSISYNINLNFLKEDVFEGLVNVKTVFMAKNGFRHVVDVTRTLSPKYLPNISLLDLNENLFHVVEQNEFLPMNGSTLESLNLHFCGIEYIHPATLEPLRNLTRLRIGKNFFNKTTLTRLVEHTVDVGIPLTLLNLYNVGLRKKSPKGLLNAIGRSGIFDVVFGRNHFDEIDDNFFPYMPNLTTLDLRDCMIGNVSPKAFQGMPFLDTLLLGENKLTYVPKAVMLKSLLLLDMSGNSNEAFSYFYIEDRIFESMTNLDDLQMSYNTIEMITAEMFVGLKNLTKLNLKNTSLYYIEPGSFAVLENLVHLNLINNPSLGSQPLTADTFLGLRNLQELLLGGCKIQNLTTNPGLFTHTKNLTFLDLTYNDLHTICHNQLPHLESLHKIVLSENKLTPWNKPILPHGNLKVFSAAQNKFSYLTTAMMEDWQKVEWLNLDGNPFACDCSLCPVVKWLRVHKMSLNYQETDDFVARCVSPEKWQRKSMAVYVVKMKDNPYECEPNTLNLLFTISFSVILLFFAALFGLLIYFYRNYIHYWTFLLKLSLIKHNLWHSSKSKLLNRRIDYKYDAFVSYSNEDRSFVLNLVDMLENYEPYLKLCVYERDFQIGNLISESVLQSVALSKRTLLIVSNAFAKSNWCRWETQLAEYHQLFFGNDNADGPDDTLLIIKLENVSSAYITLTLKYLLETRIYLKWEPNNQQIFWQKLRTALSAAKGNIKNKNLLGSDR